jgi:hypothetical protein
MRRQSFFLRQRIVGLQVLLRTLKEKRSNRIRAGRGSFVLDFLIYFSYTLDERSLDAGAPNEAVCL